MIIVNNTSTCPYHNLSTEEYLMWNFDEDIFMLWCAKNCVLLGKNQNVYRQINIEYTRNNNINIVRRSSGGGTIFCDLGTIQFTFITTAPLSKIDYSKFTLPLQSLLSDLGIKSNFSGRNDLLIDNKKFSGNAQYSFSKRCLHHGSILFDTDVNKLQKALKIDKVKYKDRKIDSHKSRVTNIINHLKKQISVTEFMELFNDKVKKMYSINSYYDLTDNDLKEIYKIRDNKYKTWDYTYGTGAKYEFNNIKKFSSGVLEVCMNVKKGIITDIIFMGDFLSRKDVSDIQTAMIGNKHDYETIKSILGRFELYNYFNNIKADEILKLMF